MQRENVERECRKIDNVEREKMQKEEKNYTKRERKHLT